MKKLILFTIIILVFLDVYSQNGDKDTFDINDFYVDFTQKDISAFSILDIAEDKINRPGTINELAMQFDAFGFSESEIPKHAIEISPYKLWKHYIDPGGLENSLDEYRKTSWLRNFGINYASKVDSNSASIAYGLTWIIVDKSDILLNKDIEDFVTNKLNAKVSLIKNANDKFRVVFEHCLANFMTIYSSDNISETEMTSFFDDLKFTSISSSNLVQLKEIDLEIDSAEMLFQDSLKLGLNEAAKSNLKALITEYNKAIVVLEEIQSQKLKEELEKSVKEWKHNSWNALAIQVSGGVKSFSPNKTWDSLDSESFAAILNFSIPIDKIAIKKSNLKSQIVGQVIYNKAFNEEIQYQEKFSIGARYLFGNYKHRIAFEYLYANLNYNNSINSYSRISLGMDLQVDDNTWFEMSYGFANRLSNEWKFEALAGAKFSFQEKPKYFSN